MDVSLSGRRVFSVFIILISLTQVSCGNRYDLADERGRQSRIDDANFHLSKGECSAAAEAIDPLYNSPYVNDEVRIIKASATACFARFNLLKFLSGFSGASNYFSALAKSMDNTSGDAARNNMYSAVDILTQNNVFLGAGSRTRAENTYMVFLQFGLISTILRNYGSPNPTTGAQGADLVYETAGANPVGEMSNKDACALAAAFSFVTDSYSNSDITDSDSGAVVNALNSVCTSAGLVSCGVINRDRSLCTGANTQTASTNAEAVVTSINAAW